MTLTNHIQRIEELAGEVNELCEKREYEMAHSALDNMRKIILEVRELIDNLQLAAGQDTK